MYSRSYISRLIMIVISLVIAWSLKYHYSHSSSDDLVWILAPTSYLVEMTGDMTFVRETNTGYVNHESGIIIAPSCAGVNFMIIAFCLSAYIGLMKLKTAPMQFVWIMVSLAVSYGYTLMVNIFRINISIYSIKTELLQEWFSRDTVHLFEGVLIYFIFLLILNYLLNRIINPALTKHQTKPFTLIKRLCLPLFFYLSFTLLVPILNHGGFPPNKGFVSYAFIVLVTCPLILLLFFLLKACCHYVAVRVK